MATEILRPNADTWVKELICAVGDHYSAVDEAVADEDTSYVYKRDSEYFKDLYGIPDHSEGSGIISKITVYVRCKPQFSGYPESFRCRVVIKSDSIVTESEEIEIPDSGYTTFSKEWDINPADNEAWEWDDIDALEIGVALKSYGSSHYTRCTQVYVVVDYTAGAIYYHGLKVQGVGELALCDVGSHPLRIRKGGATYGIELVATDDPNASKIRIKTGAGVKAIRKYS